MVITEETILQYLTEVTDPEIPVLNIVEMGIVRSIAFEYEKVIVSITPTYSGCPAMRVIENDISLKLREKGVSDVVVRTIYSPAWTTDWMSAETKQKLTAYGIAPPQHNAENVFVQITLPQKIHCPYCNSDKTTLKSDFSSTACKSLYVCNACIQPFEHFKEF